jgi:hypothetical protein
MNRQAQPPAATPVWHGGEWWCWDGWGSDRQTGEPLYRPLFSQHMRSVYWSDLEGCEIADKVSPYYVWTTTGEGMI